MHFGLVLSHFEFEGFRTVMPALRLRSGQAPAGIQGEQAAACGYSAWIPAFAGMTQPSSTPHNHHDRLLGRTPKPQRGIYHQPTRVVRSAAWYCDAETGQWATKGQSLFS